MNDAAIFDLIFNSEGALHVSWEVASRCDCYSQDTRQPEWGHEACAGLGAIYAPAVTIRALFRAQSRWSGRRVTGQMALADAQLTTRLEHKPGWVDERIRDRYVLLDATGDSAGKIFYPSAAAVPFVVDGVQRAWRVQLQGLDQNTRTLPQP